MLRCIYGVLVRTGKYRAGNAAGAVAPEVVLTSVALLPEWLAQQTSLLCVLLCASPWHLVQSGEPCLSAKLVSMAGRGARAVGVLAVSGAAVQVFLQGLGSERWG
jgi:hypothetical protein